MQYLRTGRGRPYRGVLTFPTIITHCSEQNYNARSPSFRLITHIDKRRGIQHPPRISNTKTIYHKQKSSEVGLSNRFEYLLSQVKTPCKQKTFLRVIIETVFEHILFEKKSRFDIPLMLLLQPNIMIRVKN